MEFVMLAMGLIAVVVTLYGMRTTPPKVRREIAAPIGLLPENTSGFVIGRAEVLDRTLTAPLSGRRCVYYIARVEQHVDEGTWSTLAQEERGVPFVIEDASGRAIVEPVGAMMELDFAVQGHSSTFDGATPAEEALLVRLGHTTNGLPRHKPLRYLEAIIEIGEAIAVRGGGVREIDPAEVPGGYRDRQSTRLRFITSQQHPLAISDNPRTTWSARSMDH